MADLRTLPSGWARNGGRRRNPPGNHLMSWRALLLTLLALFDCGPPEVQSRNAVALMGQSLACGTVEGEHSDPIPPIEGELWIEDGNRTADGWPSPVGPESGLLTDGSLNPPLQLHKLCAGATSLRYWLDASGADADEPAFLDSWVPTRFEEVQQAGFRGPPEATCWVQGTAETKTLEGAAGRYDGIMALQDRLQAITGAPHLLLLTITGGDPEVLPYLDEVEAADRQAAADDPCIVIVETADIFATEIRPDGKHLSPVGERLLGERCLSALYTEGFIGSTPTQRTCQ